MTVSMGIILYAIYPPLLCLFLDQKLYRTPVILEDIFLLLGVLRTWYVSGTVLHVHM